MSNIKDIQVLNEKAIAVKDPDVLVNKRALITIPEAGLSWLHYLDEYDNDVAQPVEINGTSWSILGMSDKLTEEKWKKVVIRWDSGKYNDYERHLARVDTATESGQSLLKQKGIEVPHFILINNG